MEQMENIEDTAENWENGSLGMDEKYVKKSEITLEDIKRSALIQPFEYMDEETGNRISISVSPYYSKLTINDRDYFFVRETGVFDGHAENLLQDGPILVYTKDSSSGTP